VTLNTRSDKIRTRTLHDDTLTLSRRGHCDHKALHYLQTDTTSFKTERKDCIDFSRKCWFPNPAIYGLSIVGFQGQEEDAAMLRAADGLLDYS
jgi:hypothetical protein